MHCRQPTTTHRPADLPEPDVTAMVGPTTSTVPSVAVALSRPL
jgi:hypothetical protein